LSDQTEKPKGALPKGYDPNAPSEPEVQHKKINFRTLVGYTSTDQDQREKDLKEYESSYLARLEKNKPEESSDDFRVDLGVSIESDDDLGKLNLRKHTVTKLEELQEERLAYEQKYLDRYAEPKIKKKKVSSSLYKPETPKPKRDMRKERKEYEQKYISRYKQPKSKPTKSSNLKHDTDLGTLTLGQYVNAKRKTKQDEIREYEKQYLSRYKQPKSGVKKSSNLKHDTDLGTLTLGQYVNAKRKTKQDEIREYEKQYLSRYKQPKPKKWTKQLEWEPEPKQDMKKERKEYESEFLTRYKKQQKAKPKNTSKNKKNIEIESDEKNQVEVKIQKKEPDSLSTKFETVKQEYNVTIKNLMDAKKILSGIKEDIQKSNSEYADIISKTKLSRVELLKTNNELQKKTEGNVKIAEEYKKQNLLTEEISNSKRELSEIKDEIKKYVSELESVRTNANNSPDFKKMREEKEKLENEIIQKRKDLDSGFRELKFIKDEMVKSSKSDKEIWRSGRI